MITYDTVMYVRNILKKFQKQDMQGSLAFKIEGFLAETQQFENMFIKEQIRLANMYAEKMGDGCLKIIVPDNTSDTCIAIPKDNIELFENELNSFLDQELNYHFDEDNFFTRDELASIKCTPDDIGMLIPFIKE